MRLLLRIMPIGLLLAAAAGLSGCGSWSQGKPDFQPTVARFFLETADRGASTVVLPISGVRIAVDDKPVLTEADIAGVELVQVELGKCLLFQFTPSAARDLYRISGSHQGRRLVLLLNNVALGARRLEAPLADGELYMFVEVPEAEQPALVGDLKKTTAQIQRAVARKL